MNPKQNGIQDLSTQTVELPDETVVAESEVTPNPSSGIFTSLIKPDVLRDNLDKISQQVGEVITTPKIPDTDRLRRVAVITVSGLAVGMAVHFLRQSRLAHQPDEVTK
ncbi:MAG: hypothetical protein AAF629_00265 [Chloroflexota bacterium]